MSQHDCYLSGLLQLRADAAPKAVESAIAKVLCRRVSEEAVDDGVVVADGKIDFQLPISFSCCALPRPNEIESLAQLLGDYVSEGGWLELSDSHAGDPREATAVFFVGGSDADKLSARARYGLALAEEWVRVLVGDEKWNAIVGDVVRAAAPPSRS